MEYFGDGSEQWGVMRLGNFLLSDLANAFESVEDDPQYDILYNNCGDFILRFGSVLGIHPTAETVAWTSKLLVDHSAGSLSASMLHRNKDAAGLDIDDSMGDYEVVHRVVTEKAKAYFE